MKLTSKLKIALKSLLSVSLSEVETDKATLIYDGELAEGIEVFVRDEEAEDGVKPAEDGSYETDTQIIEVADGKVVKITDKEEENVEENVELSDKKAEFSSKKAAFEATYNEKMQKIYEAIRSKEGFSDSYIIDAADDFAIVEVWNEDTATWADFRVEISWDEEGNAIAGDFVEVEHKYVTKEESEKIDEEREDKVEMADEEPADEPETGSTEENVSIEDRVAALETLQGEIKDALEQILNGIAGLEGRIDTVEEKVAKLDETPADEPADSEVELEENTPKSKMSYLRKK